MSTRRLYLTRCAGVAAWQGNLHGLDPIGPDMLPSGDKRKKVTQLRPVGEWYEGGGVCQ